MSAITPNDREPAGLSVLLNDVADVSVLDPGLDFLYGFFKALPRVGDQTLGFVRHLADKEGFVQVAVVAAVIHCHVNVADVTVLKGTHVRNAVTNHLVDTDATALGELEQYPVTYQIKHTLQ